jgi:Tripartite tricarboxylate transporter TctB family
MTWTLGRVVLVTLGMLFIGMLLATPVLIKPFPLNAPWYESAAMFPRVALVLAALGAALELVLRRKNLKVGDSDELDSSSANLGIALWIIGAFASYCVLAPLLGYLTSTLLFLLVGARVVGLPWKTTLMISVSISMVMWAVFKLALKVAFGHGWLI